MSRRLERIQDWEALAKAANYEPGSMAALCPISIRQLQRHFLLEFQKTPRQWARELQCRLAVKLISRGYSNKAVVDELKFASESHFCHEFKKVFGVSPQTFAPIFGDGKDCRLRAATSLSDNNVAFKQFRSIAGHQVEGI